MFYKTFWIANQRRILEHVSFSLYLIWLLRYQRNTYSCQFENRLMKKSCVIKFTVPNYLAFLVRFDILFLSDQKVFEPKVVTPYLTKLGFSLCTNTCIIHKDIDTKLEMRLGQVKTFFAIFSAVFQDISRKNEKKMYFIYAYNTCKVNIPGKFHFLYFFLE